MKITHSNSIDEVPANHQGEILKKVFITKGEIPNLMMFSSATFKPGQKVEMHKHDTMFEVFYVQNGKAEFIINNTKHLVETGDCITVEPGEFHSQSNPFNEDVTWLYFGIAVD
ncbi:cupin domain-containing protein [Polaribacter sp. R77954]|uniref:cupin domain-containing protein n=1 Tax=Polaribacter sp. R77954 TaxID=3093870 RepID=UPI0037C9FD78